MRYLYFVLVTGFFLQFALLTPALEAQSDPCAGHVAQIPIRRILASAALFANLRNRPGSISFESNAIFEKAIDQAAALAALPQTCPRNCVAAQPASMVFRSAPHKLLEDYDDRQHCELLLKATSAKPFTYENPTIESLDDLNEWIGDLSQGDGDAGEDLYERCDESCSPRFEYTITKNQDDQGYTAHASVICGHARDKDDNQYDLDSFFQWRCEKAASTSRL